MSTTSNLPFSLDYGVNNPAFTPASEMSLEQFSTVLTTVDFNYDYSDPSIDYDTKSAWEEIANSTEQAISASKDFVWDSATGTWNKVKSGVSDFSEYVETSATKISEGIFGAVDSVMLRLLLIFAIFIAGLYLLAKSGFLKQLKGLMP